jgi:ABC-type methionine transport system ATPase subunit
MPSVLRVEGIACSRGAARLLFGDVSFTLGPGEALVITGASGCGKSSLLEICAGLLTPSAGTVFWDERRLVDLRREELLMARRGVGYVFQTHALICNMTVFDNIALPLRYHGGDEQECRDRADDALEQHGLTSVAGVFPEVLSAAQLRQAALARALVVHPHMLFLDEPTAGFDAASERAVVDSIKRVRAARPMAVLVASTSDAVLRGVPGRVAQLGGGRLTGLAG